jgi:hypothetical protein
MSVRIPWIKTPAWRVEVSLEQLPFVLDFRYNSIAEAWFMDVLLRDETIVVGGIKLVQGAALLQQHIDDRLPPGEFVVVSSGVCGCAPDYDEMGAGASLIYVPSDELSNAV